MRSRPDPAAVASAIPDLGARIAAARQRRGWTQECLATRAGITRPTVQRVERGEPGTGIGAYAAVLWAMGLEGGVRSLADEVTSCTSAEAAVLEIKGSPACRRVSRVPAAPTIELVRRGPRR